MAVTDANLMVGKLLPDFFPHVFGPSADRPLDAEVVRAAFAALAHEVARSTGIDRSPEELAHGCLAIANDNMANAIKEISVQRGIDVTHYALCCFGGAGSQHACQVADLLGSAASSSTPMPRSCRPMAWASPTFGCCASRRSSGPSTKRSLRSWKRR